MALDGASAAVHLCGSTPGNRNAASLGRYSKVEGQMEGDRYVYQSDDGARRLWWTGGSWFVGPAKAQGKMSGFFVAGDAAFLPEKVEAVWESAGGGWHPSPLLKCISQEAHAAAVAEQLSGAEPVVHLSGKTPGNRNATSLGAYTILDGERSEDRHVYKSDGGARCMWYVGGGWWVGPASAKGTRSGYMTVADGAWRPELIGGTWEVGGSGWAPAPEVTVLTAAQKAAELSKARSGVSSVVWMTGATPDRRNAGKLGRYTMVEGELLHDRHVYLSDSCTDALWWVSGAWFVGKVEAKGKMSGFFTAQDGAGYKPEGVSAVWEVGGRSWDAAPTLQCATAPLEPPSFDDGKFVDAEFPPRETAGHGSKMTPDCFLRVPHLLTGSKGVLFDGIEPSDIVQGKLGNCWLLAAFACVAEFPKLIDKLFVEDTLSPAGQYTIKLFDVSLSSWVDVVVDDTIPCVWHHGCPLEAFTAATGHEAWVLLLEKAFAKFCGSYSALDGGFPSWAFLVLLGPKSEILIYERKGADWFTGILDKERVKAAGARDPHQSRSFSRLGDPHMASDGLFAKLQQTDLDDAVAAASIDSADGEKARDDGLVEGHAFSVLQLVEIEGLRLVQLRNPWGSEKEWLGAWSDASLEWDSHPSVKAALEFEPGPNGLFWMAWDDFASIFTRIAICSTADAHGFDARSRRRGPSVRSRLLVVDDVEMSSEAVESSSDEQAYQKKLRAAFRVFDKDNSGYLMPSELAAILTRPGADSQLSADSAARLIEQFDKDKDGKLDVDEFIQAFSTFESMLSR